MGTQTRAGFLLAVEEQNAAGGINGRPIEVVLGNDGGSVEQAITEDERLITQGGIKFFFGHSTSTFYPAIEEILSRYEVLYFSPTLSTTHLSGIDDLFLRCMPSQRDQALTLLKLLRFKKFRKTSLIYDETNTGYADLIVKIIKEKASDYGVEILNSTAFGENPDYREIVEESIGRENDSVIFISSGYDAGYLAQFAKKNRPFLNLIGSEWTKAGEIITHAGKAAEGMLFASAREVEEGNPDYINYKKKYYETFSQNPELVSLKAYEGARILFEGMEKAKELTPVAVKKSIIDIGTFSSLRGEIRIDQFGDASSSMGVYKLTDGCFELVYLIEGEDLVPLKE